MQSLIGIPGHYATRQGRVGKRLRGQCRARPLLLERLENRLCLSTWGEPVNLGPVVNSSNAQAQAALSPDGLSIYFTSNRPGGFGNNDIWVSQRASLTDPWGPPNNLGPTINDPGSTNFVPNFAPDGHRLFFTSTRPGGYGVQDIWVSWRDDIHDDFGWQPAVNLGPGVNSPYINFGPNYFEDRNTGITTLYFASTRPDRLGIESIYASTLQSDGTFGAAVLVPELSSPYMETRTAIRSDGLEIFFGSNRPGGIGTQDIWVSTRASTVDPWSTPVNLGTPINIAGFDTGGMGLSSDGNAMFFTSNRPGGFGNNDLYMSTRLPMVADHFTLSASASTTAGQSLSLTLTAWDHYGNIATGYTGTVSFASSDPHASLPASYTFTAADNGTHAFDAALLRAGPTSIKVTEAAGQVIGTYTRVVVNPAPSDHFLITAAPTAVSGTPFDVTVNALDPYGNLDTNYTGTATWASSDSDPGVVLPVAYAFQANENGTHTFTAGVMLITPGDQTLTATDTVSGITGTATVTVGPAAPAPPGGGVRRPWIPSINTNLNPTQVGLLFARRKHDGRTDDLLGAEGAVPI